MLVFMTAVGLEIKDQLIEVVMAPLKGGKLIYLTPGGGFNFIFTLSLYFGLLLTIPVITYQIYRFLQPMLVAPSRKFVTIYISVSASLAATGAAMAYFVAIPAALGFFNEVGGTAVIPNLTADSYLQFVVTYMVGLAALFQLPLLLFLADHIKPIPPGKLAKSQRYGIVATTVFAGFVTPSPDLLNYAIVLLPILGAYEVGVLAVWVRRKYIRDRDMVVKNRKEYAHEEDADAEVKQEPLTSIVEEMAEENAVQAEQDKLAARKEIEAKLDVQTQEPEKLTEPIVNEAPEEQAAPVEQQAIATSPEQQQHDANQAAAAYYAQQLAYQQQMYAYQQAAYAQQQAALAQQQQAIQPVQQVPETKRNIDGVQRVAQRYKTNVHVPSRSRTIEVQSISPQQSAESPDGLLTAEA